MLHLYRFAHDVFVKMQSSRSELNRGGQKPPRLEKYQPPFHRPDSNIPFPTDSGA